ncbi:MAG: flagellin [Anaerolineae bacterium]|jgi:flagellin
MVQADFTRIASNIAATNALNSLRDANRSLGIHQTRLATGRRINTAEEDPAGLSIATKMGARSEALKVALDNIGDAKNMLSVAEAGLGKISDILVQMRTKATAAASDTLGAAERSAIQSQLNAWAEEINSIVATTKWNGNALLDGLKAFGGTVTFQVGADTDAANQVTLSGSNFSGVDTISLGLGITAQSATAGAYTDLTGGTAAPGGDEVGVATDTPTVHEELETAGYTLRVDATTLNSTKVQLLDAGGNVVQIDDGTGTLVDTVTIDLSSADQTVSTGRGLQFTFTKANFAAGEKFEIAVDYRRAGSYNGDVSDDAKARAAMDALDSAITTVSSRLSAVGAIAGRLSFREQALTVAQINTEAAFSRVLHADMAKEQVEATRWGILQQTGIAMLGQANQLPMNVLGLFR